MTVANGTIPPRRFGPPMQFARIILDTGGTVTLCAGIVGSTIDVYGFSISANGTTKASFWSAATNSVSGDMNMVNGFPFAIVLPYGSPVVGPGQTKTYPLFSTNDGEALILNSTGGVGMAGIVYYIQRLTSSAE